MATKGHRPKKPLALKQLQGTVQPCRDADTPVIQGNLKTLPPAPKYLKNEGLIYYENQGTAWLNLGVLNEYNLPLFLQICLYITLTERYAKKIILAEDDLDTERSYRRMYDEAHKNMRLAMSEFGLTPASVSKVKESAKKDKSDLQKFIDS